MDKLHLKDNTVLSCADQIDSIMNKIYDNMQVMQQKKNDLNFFEDARQLYDERIYFRMKEMKNAVESCIAIGEYLRNLVLVYTQAEVTIVQNMAEISTAFNETRKNNDNSYKKTVDEITSTDDKVPTKDSYKMCTTPSVRSDESTRDPEIYNKVVQQFDVETHIKYKKNKDGKGYTYCNYFALDVLYAMGVWDRDYGFENLGCRRLVPLFEELSKDPDSGWHEITAEEAQAAANAGKPTIALTSGHIQVVVPERAGEKNDVSQNGPMVAQAGASNFEYGTCKRGMGSEFSQVKYYSHD